MIRDNVNELDKIYIELKSMLGEDLLVLNKFKNSLVELSANIKKREYDVIYVPSVKQKIEQPEIISFIKNEISILTKVAVNDINGFSYQEEHIFARDLTRYILRSKIKISYPTIAESENKNKSKSTIIYSVNKIKAKIQNNNKQVIEHLEVLIPIINQHLKNNELNSKR